MQTNGNQSFIHGGNLAMRERFDNAFLNDERAIPPESHARPATLQSALKQHERVSVSEEKALFARLHFLRFRREALKSTLNTSGGRKQTSREIDDLTREIDSARNLIMEKFLRLLASIARELASSSQDYDDYFSEGSTVLMRAIETFDPSRGFRFSTYATHAVRRHLYRFSKRRATQQKREIPAEMSFRSQTCEDRADRIMTDQETADATNMLLEQIHTLDEREREIVVNRFGLGDDRTGKSFQTMSAYMGLSKERIRQLFYGAMQKLGQSVQPHFH
jgi:RNA polymerase primary sigma factor